MKYFFSFWLHFYQSPLFLVHFLNITFKCEIILSNGCQSSFNCELFLTAMVSACDWSHIKVLPTFFSHPPSSAARLSYVFLNFTNKLYCRNLQFITVKSNYRLLKLYYIRQIANFTEREKKKWRKRRKERQSPKNDYKSKYKKVVCLLQCTCSLPSLVTTG